MRAVSKTVNPGSNPGSPAAVLRAERRQTLAPISSAIPFCGADVPLEHPPETMTMCPRDSAQPLGMGGGRSGSARVGRVGVPSVLHVEARPSPHADVGTAMRATWRHGRELRGSARPRTRPPRRKRNRQAVPRDCGSARPPTALHERGDEPSQTVRRLRDGRCSWSPFGLRAHAGAEMVCVRPFAAASRRHRGKRGHRGGRRHRVFPPSRQRRHPPSNSHQR